MIVPLAYSAEAAPSAAKAGRRGFGRHPSLWNAFYGTGGEKSGLPPEALQAYRAKGGGAEGNRTLDLLNAIRKSIVNRT